MKKTNFDRYLEEQLEDPDFAGRFEKAGEAWDVALQLAALREKAGLSQKDLARTLKTSQQNISRLESPAYEGHSLTMLRRVAEVLGATIRVTIAPRDESQSMSLAWRLTGNGGRLLDGAPLNANSMSVVLRLHHENHPVVLIPGDMDASALEDIIDRNQQLTADILIFPHHGGNVSTASHLAARQTENATFTTDLLNRCTPNMVVFSIGRGLHATPRPEIVQLIRNQPQPCLISCTQLSEHCHAGATPTNPGHLAQLPARGKSSNRCCGGSMEIALAGNRTVAAIIRQQHADFIANHIRTPLCAISRTL